jgi:PQQ-like domain
MVMMRNTERLVAVVAIIGFVLQVKAVGAASAAAPTPIWTRPLAAVPTGTRVLQPLSDGSLLVRNGDGIITVDARGKTLWSEPHIDGALVDGGTVVFRRSKIVFAVRRTDAGVLWKRPCVKPEYLVAAGDRVLTTCGGQSTVLRAQTGAVVSQRTPRLPLAQPPFRLARPLTADYVLVESIVAGGWLGEAYHVVDAHTGAFLWTRTDADFFDVSATAVSLAPYPGMMPWGPTGTVERRRLSDGTLLGTDRYAPPRDGDLEGRGKLAFSHAAAYVNTLNATTYRFSRGSRTPERLAVPAIGKMLVLGDGAFFIEGTNAGQDGAVYLDRPGERGFTLRPVGHHAGDISSMPLIDGFVDLDSGPALRIGDRVAVSDGDVLRLYDERGSVEVTVPKLCAWPQLAITATTLYMMCPPPLKPGLLAAFPRR